MGGSFKYSYQQRLLDSARYTQILKTVRPFYLPELVLYAAKNDLAYARLGLIVSKRKFALSVMRNKIKRIIRENFRLHQNLLEGMDIVIVARTQANNLETIANNLKRAWVKLRAKSC